MPELPDVVVYIDCLTKCVANLELQRIQLANSFVLPSVTPPLEAVEGRPVTSLRRLGKRIVFVLADQLFIVLHLMIAGRLWWRPLDDAIPKKCGLAAFDFPNGSLLLTEAGSTKRASIHLVRGETALEAHDRAGLEILDTDLPAFRTALLRENHTLKRALTDPRLFSGGGNAYCDEILQAARLSLLKLTQRLEDEEVVRLHAALRDTLAGVGRTAPP